VWRRLFGLPFLLTVTQIGIEMRPLERTTDPALLAAGICLAFHVLARAVRVAGIHVS
jgi:hypothetical protein